MKPNTQVRRAVDAFRRLATACIDGKISGAVGPRDELRDLGFDVYYPAQPPRGLKAGGDGGNLKEFPGKPAPRTEFSGPDGPTMEPKTDRLARCELDRTVWVDDLSLSNEKKRRPGSTKPDRRVTRFRRGQDPAGAPANPKVVESPNGH